MTAIGGGALRGTVEVKGLSKKQNLTDRDNGAVNAVGREVEEMKEGVDEINGNGWRLDLRWENTIHCTY